MTPSDWVFERIYFGAQRVRGGVSRDMVVAAGRVLESAEEEWRGRALTLLGHVHGSGFDWAALTEQPVVERSTLIAPAREALTNGRGGVDKRRTSGSTGTPFSFPKDRIMTAWMDAAMWAVYSWHGVYPGAPHARFWGVPLQPGRRARVAVSDFLLHRRRVSAFSLSPRSVARQFERLRSLRAVYAYGYPTLMRAFVELARTKGLDGEELGLRVVISTGEILTPDTRHELANFFGCPIVNEYGCTESGILGFECEHATMHAIPVAAWPEIVDAAGAPVAQGVEGEIVVSDLYGSTMPLTRYQLHDRGTWTAPTCPCGRELPQLNVISGRSDSFIETPRGPVYDAILAYTVPAGVQRFKVYQRSPDHLDALIVPGVGFAADRTPRECQRRWEEAVGPGVRVSVETVADLPLEPSGKLRYFVPLGSGGDQS